MSAPASLKNNRSEHKNQTDTTISGLIKALKTPLLNQGSEAEKRQEIKTYFNYTFDQYESLFQLIVRPEAYYLRPEPLRHPLIFYFGHTATFFINKCILAKLISERVNETFESMFAIGVDEMSWDDLNDDHYDWPTLASVIDYRHQVRAIVNNVIDTMPLSLPIQQTDPAWVILMGIEHERIHLETSSVLIRMLPINEVQTSNDWPACSKTGYPPENQLIKIPGKQISLGKPNSDNTFGWDNEFGQKEVAVPSFQVSQTLVSNQEFLAFINDEGYHNQAYWTQEGQDWLHYTKATMPRFWLRKNGEYFQRNLTEEIPLPLNWPVEVNYLEAKAFCNWLSKKKSQYIRLPIEAEWLLLRDEIKEDQPDWIKAPGNINLEYHASSCPIDTFYTQTPFETASDNVAYQDTKHTKIYDITGNVWQWTETPIDGYPGFKVHPIYDDFSTPTFDNKHNLIKGGSWISTGNEALKHSRYAFRRHFFQHAGFRYIQSEEKEIPVEQVNAYETDDLISQYLEFHYGTSYFNTPNFPAACVQACIQAMGNAPKTKALDLGCAVGRSSFELAKHFNKVDGIDFSARFIQCCFRLAETSEIKYTITTEGDLVDYRNIQLADHELDNLGQKLHFAQGDAVNLKPEFSGYDLIFAGNLIDRLYQPEAFLKNIERRLNSKGWLILTSPYTWLTEYTKKEQWLGGFKVNGENFTSFDGLSNALAEHFEFIDKQDIPFVIRETARKFQHTIAQMTIWRKKT